MNPVTNLGSPAVASSSRQVILAASGLAAFFGLFLLWGVGFAGPEQIHNAAHDTRHSFVFPCH